MKILFYSVLGALTILSAAHGAGDSQLAAHPKLLNSPYPTQHASPRRSDYIEHPAPLPIEKAWEALSDSMVAQPCASGTHNRIYCTRAWDRRLGKCNLVAIDAGDGSILWSDRVDGSCLLDQLAWISAPLVDAAGNIYAADSLGLVSFTANGQLRWRSKLFADLPSRLNQPNVAFGLNMTPGGDLVMATMGDGWILLVDRDTGKLKLPPFDLPSAKSAVSNPPPPGFMSHIASPLAAQVLWEISVGGSPYEVDNDLALDPVSGLLFVAAGGPRPNEQNIGALWAIEIGDKGMQIAFFVPMNEGQGGSGTTPTVTHDSQYVLVGDNAKNFLVVDIAACLSVATGAACQPALIQPTGKRLGASFVATPDNRIIIATAGNIQTYDLDRDDEDRVTIKPAWRRDYTPLVITGFENILYFPTMKGHLVGLDIDTGSEIIDKTGAFAANVTLAGDGKTIITNNISFGKKASAGVWGWRATD